MLVVRESASSIDAAAAAWVSRLDRGLTDVEKIELEEWLAGDNRRLGALARAQATWLHVGRVKVLGSDRVLQKPGIAALTRRTLWWLSAAATVASLAMGLWAWQGYMRTHVSTGTGEIRELHLADGSRVTLGTQCRVSLHYEPALRGVRLESGEALFRVASDPNRPFVVQAGNVRVRAVGTEFDVRRSDRGVEVTVAEGTVDVWRELASHEPAVRVAAGSRTFITREEISAPQALTGAQVERSVEWTTGTIDFNGKTLGEAAAELNRYNRRAIVIADPALAAHKIIGRFRVTDPDAFANAAAAMLDAHVRTDDNQLILEPGRPLQK
jgi:transmembrane sensor